MKSIGKIAMLVLNIAAMAVCVMAIVGYVAGPFWKITATVSVTQEMADKITSVSTGGPSSGGEDSGADTGKTTSGDEMLKSVLDQMVKDKVKLPISLTLTTGNFLNSLTSKDNSPVDGLIDDIVDGALGDEFKKEVDKVKKSATKGTTKAIVKQAVADIKNNNEAFKEKFGDKTVDEVLTEAGVTDEVLDEKTEVIYGALTTDNTVEKATDEIISVVNDIYKIMSESDFGKANPDIFNGEELDTEEVKTEVAKVLVALNMVSDGEAKLDEIDTSSITDEMLEEGLKKTINISGAIDKMILEALKGAFGEGGAETPSDDSPIENPKPTPGDTDEPTGIPDDKSAGVFSAEICGYGAGKAFAAGLLSIKGGEVAEDRETNPGAGEISGGESANGSDGAEGDNEDVYAEIATLLKDKLKSSVPEEVKGGLLIAMKVVGVLIALSALVWVYILVKLVVNTLTGRMVTKFKLAIIFGWVPALNLVVLPNLFFRIFSTNNFIVQKLPAEVLSAVKSITDMVNMRFSSGAIYALIAAGALIAVWILRKVFTVVFKADK